MTCRGFAVAFLLLAVPSLRAGDEEAKQTIAFLQKLQTDNGSFRPGIGKDEPTLRSTSSAIRALQGLKATVPHKDACVRFVESCYAADVGAFRDTPTGKADVNATSIGLMAVAALELPAEKYVPKCVQYLADNARTFEEVRLAAGGLEAVKAKSPVKNAWLRLIRADRNFDGSYGADLGMARATASAVVAEIRLGAYADNQRIILLAMRERQHKDGGWGKAADSDLETSYRVMRCFKMLDQQPVAVGQVDRFLQKCRNPDGGYGVTPGAPSTVAGTYYATVIRQWVAAMQKP